MVDIGLKCLNLTYITNGTIDRCDPIMGTILYPPHLIAYLFCLGMLGFVIYYNRKKEAGK